MFEPDDDVLHQGAVLVDAQEPGVILSCIKAGSADGCITDASGNATVSFTANGVFSRKPAVLFTAMDNTSTMPISFKITAWSQDGLGNYTGCTVQARRARTLPSVIALLSALINYDPTEVAPSIEFCRAAMLRAS